VATTAPGTTDQVDVAPVAPRAGWVPTALMLTMAAWGMNLPIVKVLTASFDLGLITTLRMAVACGVFALMLRWRRQPWPRFTPRQWAGLALCAFLMVYVNQLFFVAGMQRTSAVNAALIMATAPLISSVMASLAFGERLHARHLLAVALGFGGVAVVVLHKPGAALSGGGLGDLLLMGCVVSFAAGGVLVQRLSPRIEPLTFSSVIYVFGTAMLLLQLVLTQGSSLSTERLFPGLWPWFLVLVSGIMATALGNFVWTTAIGRIGVARTAVYIYWVPVFGMGFAALLLGEPLNAWYGLGLVMVMAGSRLASQVPGRR
jgi:drug/metabolite transporter (DMT)-like permease